MIQQQHVSVVIPALNEERAIGQVVSELVALRNEQQQPLIDAIVVCDNGSSDNTASVAENAGARVVHQNEPGYGIACQTAIAALSSTDIVLFVDGDHSCVATQARSLLQPAAGGADLVIGSRTLGHIEPGALTLPQQFGNWLAARLIQLLWGAKVTDLGPYRAMRFEALQRLRMADRRFGWTVEMQIKAIQLGLHTTEVAVDSTRRIGQSKISGTVRGVIGAAHGILGTIARLRWQQWREKARYLTDSCSHHKPRRSINTTL